MEGRTLALLKRTEVLGGFDPTKYRSERIHATAPDGTRVAISLVTRADAPRDGSSPMLLAGYGAYGLPYPVNFSSSRLSLLDRGVSVALAHVRGGGEFEEWGNPKDRAYYDVMKTYDPYANLDGRRYPALLVRTSLNDSQVMYWEPAKYVARLRARSPETSVLFKINMAAGHGGASGRYDYLREIAFDYAWILGRLGRAA